MKELVTQTCLTLCDPMDCSPSGYSVHEILQAGWMGGQFVCVLGFCFLTLFIPPSSSCWVLSGTLKKDKKIRIGQVAGTIGNGCLPSLSPSFELYVVVNRQLLVGIFGF